MRAETDRAEPFGYFSLTMSLRFSDPHSKTRVKTKGYNSQLFQ